MLGYMTRAKPAGQSPGAALANASGTERSRLFIDGNGRVVHHDRTLVNNV
jgi:hypothetical protein